MESSAARRREEVDEMQQEILNMTSQAAQLEREIKSLQFELEAKEESHRLEVSKLQEKIAKYEERQADYNRTKELEEELSKQQKKVMISLESEIQRMKAAMADPDPSNTISQQTKQPDAPQPSRSKWISILASVARKLKLF
jgi:chromosome segregation ATPase